jgi:putative membrane protein
MSARNSIHDPAPRDTQPGATVSKAATVTNVEAEITEMSGITPQPTYMADEKIIEEGWAPGHGKKPSDDGIDHYFVGPRDLDSHSKLPHFMRLHGSVMPKMIVPLLVVGAWATLITVISKYVYNCKTGPQKWAFGEGSRTDF